MKAKTSGEVVSIGAIQGDYVKKDSILCSLGVVELNRTEVKAPFQDSLNKLLNLEIFLKEDRFVQL